jgi:hypothetical protein
MNRDAVRWTILTTAGLVAGVMIALIAEAPVSTLVGMILVTPILTLLVGSSVGAAQWLEMRRRVAGAGRWFVATAIGLGLGLAAGVVAVEQGGRVLTGQALRLATASAATRAAGMLAVGLTAGIVLGACQYVALRKSGLLRRSWPIMSGLGLGAGLFVGCALAEALVGDLFSPFSLTLVLVLAGGGLGIASSRELSTA